MKERVSSRRSVPSYSIVSVIGWSMTHVRRARSPLGTVCILGGSLAGLLAARVLSDHAGQVVVLERDAPPSAAESRPSVPHGQHGHFVQPQALRPLDGWFPGFADDVLDLGALSAPPGHHYLFTEGSPVDFPAVTMLMATRPLLENELRRRVACLANVRTLQAQVSGIKCLDGAVQAVTYRPRTYHGWADQRSLAVDLVVDSMGKGSRMAAWLEEAGLGVFDTERVPVGIDYTTALFGRTGVPDITCALDQFPTGRPYPPKRSDGLVFPGKNGALEAVAAYAVEDSLWQVVVIGKYSGVRISHRDVRDICAELPVVFQEAVEGNAVGETVNFHYAQSVRRVTPERGLPARLLDIGDSVACFNPIHGQGVWSAVEQASLLAHHLAHHPDPLGGLAEFIDVRDKAVDAIWTSASA